MNVAHYHLLVNHIPLFTVAFGLVAMTWSYFRRSDEMRYFAVALLVAGGLSGWLAAETGEGAEHALKGRPEFTKEWIHPHEEAAEIANIGAWILAAAAAALIVIERFRRQNLPIAQLVVILLALVTMVLMARTAYMGGQIRHTEVRQESPP